MKKYFLILLLGSLSLAINAMGTPVFTNLYSFSPLLQTNAAGVYTNFDGAGSQAGLIISGNALYGTTASGGTNGTGTLFKMNTDGTAFAVLHQFNGTNAASLVLSGSMLYGTTEFGGTNDTGTIFEMSTNGTGFTNLYNFSGLLNTDGQGVLTNGDGANPSAGLVLVGSALYGTATGGGSNGNGTIFRINADGTGFTNLYSFSTFLNIDSTNSDGAAPAAGLAFYSGVLYGTTEFGGIGGSGTVFAINTNGTAFTNLYSFSPVQNLNLTNSDGAYVFSGVIYSSGELFGATLAGGINGNGTLFALNANGGSFTNLHVFGATINSTNMDGAKPAASLALFGNTLYGTTQLGGIGGSGTIFSVSTNGSNFQNLYSFTPINSNPLLGIPTNIDGGSPLGGLVMSNNSFYGTTFSAGTSGSGGVYVFSVGPIPLHLQSVNQGVVLTWGNPAFSLLAATNAAGIYTAIPGAASPYTNSIIYPHEFFSLEAF